MNVFSVVSLEKGAAPEGKVDPTQGQAAGTGIMKHPAEEAEGELGAMFWMVRLGELFAELLNVQTARL